MGASQCESPLASFVKLGRLKFLPYSAILTLLGALAQQHATHSSSEGAASPLFTVSWRAFVHSVLFVWLIHITAHYSNEYFDYEVDKLNKRRGRWNGGSGVLVTGLLAPWVALASSLTTLAAALALILISRAVDPFTPFNDTATMFCFAFLLCGWFYTAPPVRLQYRCCGELTVALALTGVVPLVGAAMQWRQGTGDLFRRDSMFATRSASADDTTTATAVFVVPQLLRAVIPFLFVQQFVRMMIMNAPDVKADLMGGKVTLTARIGVTAAADAYALVQALVSLVPLLMATASLVLPLSSHDEGVGGSKATAAMPLAVACAFLAVAPLGIRNARRFQAYACKAAQEYGDLPFYATLHVASTALAVCISFLFM